MIEILGSYLIGVYITIVGVAAVITILNSGNKERIECAKCRFKCFIKGKGTYVCMPASRSNRKRLSYFDLFHRPEL